MSCFRQLPQKKRKDQAAGNQLSIDLQKVYLSVGKEDGYSMCVQIFVALRVVTVITKFFSENCN